MQEYYLTFSKFVNRYFYLLIIFLLVFIPLYPKFPLLNLEGTYVAIRLEDLVIFFIILVWIIIHLRKVKNLINETLIQAFLLFWFIGGLSTLSGIFITHSVHPGLGFFHWLRRIEYMSLFIIASTSIYNTNQIRLLIKVILGTLFIICFYGFGQIWLHFPVISTNNSEFSKGLILYLSDSTRVNSTFAGHYDLAMYLSIVLMIISSLFFFFKNPIKKTFLGFSGILGLTLLGLTAARVSFIAALFGIGLVILMNGKKILLVGLVVLSLGLLVAIPELRHRLVATATVNLLGGGGAKYNPPPGTVTIYTPISHIDEASKDTLLKKAQIEASLPSKNKEIASDTAPGEPVNTTELGVYRSLGIRLNVEWPRAIYAFMKNPLLGSGYSSITLATDNDILRSLGEVGLLGSISLSIIFFIIIKKMLRFIKKSSGFTKAFIIGVLNSIIILFITSIFLDVLEASKVAEFYWLLLGISWSIMNSYEVS